MVAEGFGMESLSLAVVQSCIPGSEWEQGLGAKSWALKCESLFLAVLVPKKVFLCCIISEIWFGAFVISIR